MCSVLLYSIYILYVHLNNFDLNHTVIDCNIIPDMLLLGTANHELNYESIYIINGFWVNEIQGGPEEISQRCLRHGHFWEGDVFLLIL